MGPVLGMMWPVMSLSLTDHGRVPRLTGPGHVELLLVLSQQRGQVPGPGELLQPLVDGVHLVPGEEPVSGLCHGFVAPIMRVVRVVIIVMMRSLVIIVLSWSVHSLPAPFRLPLPLLCLLLEHLDLGELEA